MVHLMFNAYWESLDFELARDFKDHPIRWCRWIDTALDAPDDILRPGEEAPVGGQIYCVAPHSVSVLIAAHPAPEISA